MSKSPRYYHTNPVFQRETEKNLWVVVRSLAKLILKEYNKCGKKEFDIMSLLEEVRGNRYKGILDQFDPRWDELRFLEKHLIQQMDFYGIEVAVSLQYSPVAITLLIVK